MTAVMKNRRRVVEKTRRAFTLLEVLIVIALLLAIGGLVVVNLLPKQAEAEKDLQRVQIDNIDGAMKMFRVDMGRFPSDEEGIRALWTKDAIEDEDDAANWKGPYLETPVPEDKWGNEWVYHQSAEQMESTYELISPGPDGEEGTDDDISNLDQFRDEEGEMGEEFDDFSMPEGDGAGGGGVGGG